MINLYSTIITLIIIILISIYQNFFKNFGFLFRLEINILYYYRYIFIIVNILFIFLLVIIFLIKILNFYLPIFILSMEPFILSIKSFILSIKEILYNNSTAHCAGVPSLVNFCNERPITQIDDKLNPQLAEYINNNKEIKTIFKYNFSLLNRKENNFYSDLTKRELTSINYNLYNIYSSNFKTYNSFLSEELVTSTPVNKLIKNIESLYFENRFKIDMIEKCNNKLAVPIYKNFYNTIFISKENRLPSLLESKIPSQITKDFINPFLIYNDIINMLDFRDESTLQRIVRCNPRIDDNIVRFYEDYSLGVRRTLRILDLTNQKLIYILEEMRKDPANRILVISEKSNLNIGEQITNSDLFFRRTNQTSIIHDTSNIILRTFPEDLTQKSKEIDNLFLRQVKRDSSLLRDIENQQSNMVVNYKKLITIMSDPNNQEYFDERTKNRILRASNGDFYLKRKRPP